MIMSTEKTALEIGDEVAALDQLEELSNISASEIEAILTSRAAAIQEVRQEVSDRIEEHRAWLRRNQNALLRQAREEAREELATELARAKAEEIRIKNRVRNVLADAPEPPPSYRNHEIPDFVLGWFQNYRRWLAEHAKNAR